MTSLDGRFQIDTKLINVLGLDQWQCSVSRGFQIVKIFTRWSKSGAMSEAHAYTMGIAYAEAQFALGNEDITIESR